MLIGLHGRSLWLACVYCPPGSCTCHFQEELLFVFLPSSNSSFYICGDFNIHVDVQVGDGYKFMTLLTRLKQLVNLPICMVTYWTSFYSPVIRILLLMSRFVILYLIMH